MNRRKAILCGLATSTLMLNRLYATPPRQMGLILNYTFNGAEDGLIRDTAPFGLHAPANNLEVVQIAGKGSALQLEPGRSLRIPESTQLNPNGYGWIIALRFHALSDGMLFSQGDSDNHIAIYFKGGSPRARIISGSKEYILKESDAKTIEKGSVKLTYKPQNFTGKWTTVTLQVTGSKLILSANRSRIAAQEISEPIRLINFSPYLGSNPNLQPNGFSGAVSSLKLLRQPI